MFVDVVVINATIHQQSGFFKPDPYVELCVDEQNPPRKTEVIAKSLSPTWNEHFTVYVLTTVIVISIIIRFIVIIFIIVIIWWQICPCMVHLCLSVCLCLSHAPC